MLYTIEKRILYLQLFHYDKKERRLSTPGSKQDL